MSHATVATKLFCHSKSLYRLKQGSEPIRGLIHFVRGANSKMIWLAIQQLFDLNALDLRVRHAYPRDTPKKSHKDCSYMKERCVDWHAYILLLDE